MRPNQLPPILAVAQPRPIEWVDFELVIEPLSSAEWLAERAYHFALAVSNAGSSIAFALQRAKTVALSVTSTSDCDLDAGRLRFARCKASSISSAAWGMGPIRSPALDVAASSKLTIGKLDRMDDVALSIVAGSALAITTPDKMRDVSFSGEGTSGATTKLSPFRGCRMKASAVSDCDPDLFLPNYSDVTTPGWKSASDFDADLSYRIRVDLASSYGSASAFTAAVSPRRSFQFSASCGSMIECDLRPIRSVGLKASGQTSFNPTASLSLGFGLSVVAGSNFQASLTRSDTETVVDIVGAVGDFTLEGVVGMLDITGQDDSTQTLDGSDGSSLPILGDDATVQSLPGNAGSLSLDLLGAVMAILDQLKTVVKGENINFVLTMTDGSSTGGWTTKLYIKKGYKPDLPTLIEVSGTPEGDGFSFSIDGAESASKLPASDDYVFDVWRVDADNKICLAGGRLIVRPRVGAP